MPSQRRQPATSIACATVITGRSVASPRKTAANALNGRTPCAPALAELGPRIVVLVDDIDRLEPKEAVEVLRLLQSASDLPHVTNVLCYDQERLHESVTQVTGLRYEAAYLEKSV